MGIALEQREDSSVIRLDGAIDISMAAELKDSLLEALASKKTLRLSLEAVTDLDVTAMQLLLAALRQAKGEGLGFALDGELPEQVSSALADTGLGTFSIAK